jgi:hypothetical protein
MLVVLLSYLIWPLRLLYRFGPDLHGFGFWNGQALSDICAQLSQVPASFWARNAAECQALYERHEFAFLISVYFFLYMLGLIYMIMILSFLIFYCCCIRPKFSDASSSLPAQ